MRFIRDLSPETQRLLRRCYKESQQHRVRQRAHCLLLSFDGRTSQELPNKEAEWLRSRDKFPAVGAPR